MSTKKRKGKPGMAERPKGKGRKGQALWFCSSGKNFLATHWSSQSHAYRSPTHRMVL